MSTTKITSEIYKIESPIKDVYVILSDFNKISRLIEIIKRTGMTSSLQLEKAADKIEDIRFTEETCHIILKNIGEITIKIVEKEEPKLIKLGGEGAIPLDFNVWIQLLENGPYDTRIKITFQAEINIMMKMLLKGKLEKGVEQLAEGLTKIPYSMLNGLPF